MYKIEEFVGTAAELEKFLNEMQVIKHFNLSHIVSRQAKTFAGPECSVDRTVYTLVFYGNDEEKKRQIYLEYAKENLCKDCLTCADFGYYCRGNKERCNAWKYDEKAHYRIDKVV